MTKPFESFYPIIEISHKARSLNVPINASLPDLIRQSIFKSDRFLVTSLYAAVATIHVEPTGKQGRHLII